MLTVPASAQIGPFPGMPPPPRPAVSAQQPNKPAPAPHPNPPPAGEWRAVAVTQSSEGPWRRLRGKAEIEGTDMLFRADEIDFNEDTQYVEARGSVYFHNFERNEEVWADRVEYYVEEEKGKFYNVRGQGQAQINARPGILVTNNPFYFQGKWAERLGDRYILYDGFITNCKMPRPWWRLRGPRFVIVPNEKALAYRSTFMLRKFPLFFTPFFYKSLEKMPRRSGFLIPNLGNSSRRGKMFGVGYYWAISRSYDATYRIQDFTERGFAHNLDMRAKPKEGTEVDAVLYGVQDRGQLNSDGTRGTPAGGLSLYVAGRSDLGGGFTARGTINYLSSFRFRQEFSESFNEAVASEVHSVGFVNRNWSYYVLNAAFARLENFQRAEVQTIDPVTKVSILQPDSVLIRKMPEVTLSGRDREIVRGPLPVWISFEGGAGLLYRSQSVFQGNVLIDRYQTGQFMNRVDFSPRLTTALRWKDWSLVPSFAVRETRYGESQTPYLDRYHVAGQDLTRSSRDVSAELIAPSLERVFNHKTWLGDKFKHVIEPRAAFRYVSGVGATFDRIIRFDTADLVSDTNYAEVSLTNRIYAKRGNEVSEVFTWELAQRRYFDPTFGGAVVAGQRNVVESTADLTGYAFLDGPRRYSPVVSSLRFSPKPGVGVTWQADYDPLRHEVVDSGLSADVRFSKYYVSAGHNQVHNVPALSPPANQLRGTVGMGNDNRRGWNAAFTTIYDYRKGAMQFAITQVTYNTDCCGFSVQFRRFAFGTRNENQYRLAFSVANIGTFGTLKKQERLF